MLGKMKKATAKLTSLLIVASLIFVYSVYAAQKKDEDKKSCIEVEVTLTLDTGGVKGIAKGKTKSNSSYGSLYLYAVVAGKKPDADQRSYYGIVNRKAETKVGSNSRNNQASAVGHDYYNNQHVDALVRGRV